MERGLESTKRQRRDAKSILHTHRNFTKRKSFKIMAVLGKSRKMAFSTGILRREIYNSSELGVRSSEGRGTTVRGGLEAEANVTGRGRGFRQASELEARAPSTGARRLRSSPAPSREAGRPSAAV